MKILMIAPQPFFQPRGTPFSVLYRIKAFCKLGHEVDLVTYHIGDDIRIKGLNIFRIKNISYITKIKIGPSFTKIFLDLFIWLKAKELAKKNHYDAVHVHEEAALFGLWLHKKHNLPMIYDMHSSMPEQLVNYDFSKNKLLISYFRDLEKKIINNSVAVISICPELEKIVKGINPKVSYLIENTAQVNEEALSQRKLQKLKYRLKPNGKKIVLYTGTLEFNQGIGMLIESLMFVKTKAPGTRFLIVGGKNNQVEKFRQMAKELNLQKNILFTGERKREDIPYFNEIADVLVSPRLIGVNTPLKIYSYLRAGKPIVATRILSHQQVLDDENSILTEVNSMSFAEGILKALSNDSQVKKIVKNAKKMAEEEYSLERYEEKIRIMLDSIKVN